MEGSLQGSQQPAPISSPDPADWAVPPSQGSLGSPLFPQLGDSVQLRARAH